MKKPARKNQNCPNCQSANVAFIQYGLPVESDELHEKMDSGEIVLGGCCVTSFSPRWKCNACNHEWGVTDFGSE